MPPAPDGVGWRLVVDTDAGIVADGGTGPMVPPGGRQRLAPEGLSVWVGDPGAPTRSADGLCAA
jgi:hypothetical protein